MDVLLHEALPQDLVKYGLIPELVGRLPVTVSLDLLDKEALIRILTEPKSAIVKQYQKLLELDGVDLEFDKDALDAIAETTLARKTGARGLRAIMENIMMDTMFTVPSDETIKGCRITKRGGPGNGNTALRAGWRGTPLVPHIGECIKQDGVFCTEGGRNGEIPMCPPVLKYSENGIQRGQGPFAERVLPPLNTGKAGQNG